jgi:hypothetical protein
MTDTNKHDRNNNSMMNPKSPNDRDKKKSKDEQTDVNESSMDVEFTNLPTCTLFHEKQPPSDTANTDTAPVPSNNNNETDETDKKNEEKDPSTTTLALLPNSATPKTSPMTIDVDAIDIYTPSPAAEKFAHAATDLVNAEDPFLTRLHLADSPIWSLPIKAAEHLWFCNPNWAKERCFNPDELDGTKCNYDESLEFDIGVALLYVSHEEGRPTTVAQWMRTYAYVFSKEDVEDIDDDHRNFLITRRMAIRLALSDPVNLFPKSSWHNGELITTSAEHAAWMASYIIFGAPWKNRTDCSIHQPQIQTQEYRSFLLSCRKKRRLFE